MKLRRILPLAAVVVLAAGAFVPAQAAPKFAGSYNVTLLPDPSPNAFHTGLGMGNCFNVNPQSVDRRELKVPGKGKLTLVLDSADPTGTGNTDWDMYVTDKSGESLGEGTGGTSHEEVSIKFKKAETVTVSVCNLAGQPNGTVTYSLR